MRDKKKESSRTLFFSCCFNPRARKERDKVITDYKTASVWFQSTFQAKQKNT
jgi:hypothetical protein